MTTPPLKLTNSALVASIRCAFKSRCCKFLYSGKRVTLTSSPIREALRQTLLRNAQSRWKADVQSRQIAIASISIRRSSNAKPETRTAVEVGPGSG